MAWMMHRWASGQRLDAVLRGQDMAAGDFVRRCKQVVDLLGQIGDAAPEPALRRHGPQGGRRRPARRRGRRPPRLTAAGRRPALRRCRVPSAPA